MERLNVNKARSPVHPPEIIDSDRIQDSHGLKVLHLNIRSLRNSEHFIQLKELNKRGKFDVITISESWLNTSVSSLEVNLEGYKLSRLDRLHMGGGGVCVYTRNNLKAKVLKDLSSISERNFHQLWISLQWKKTKSIVVCTTYRPDDCPLSAFEDTLKPTYMQALTLNKPIVILGDLNCDLRKACAESRALNNFSSEMNLQQLIKHPTRITAATTKPLLDVILVSCPQSVRGSGVINYSISDHLPVFLELKVKEPKPSPHYITARSYKNYEPGAFTADLANQSDQLLSIFSCGDVDTKLNTLNDVVGSTLALHAPVRTTRIRHRPCPFVSRGIKQLMKTRDLLHRNFFQSRDPSDWSKYKESRDTIKEILRETERNYTFLEVQQNKSNPSSLWKVINRVIPSKNKKPQRVYTKDLKTVADEFNVFFTSVGKTEALAASHLAEINNITWSEQQLPLPPAGDLFDFKRVSCEEVRRIISSLPLNKSPGPDKIHTRVYRDCLPVILGPLTEIINSSLESAKYPDAWKFAEVIPLLKEGDHEVASNNRPLSLLAVASKICDQVVLDQFSAYLFSNGRLSSHQSGNKKLHSTETLSLFMADHLLEAMDKKNLTTLTLLDLSKAFDSLNHNKLLAKLSSVGASPHVLN